MFYFSLKKSYFSPDKGDQFSLLREQEKVRESHEQMRVRKVRKTLEQAQIPLINIKGTDVKIRNFQLDIYIHFCSYIGVSKNLRKAHLFQLARVSAHAPGPPGSHNTCKTSRKHPHQCDVNTFGNSHRVQ